MESDAAPAYTPRIIDDELDVLLAGLAALSLEGPKGVGKTETALRRSVTVWAFDRPATLERARSDPDRVVGGPAPSLLDEWQRFPEAWDLVRRSVDAGASPGSFLLAGSAATDAPVHSGAGRIVRLRMRPLSLAERGLVAPTVALSDLLSGDVPRIEGECPLRVQDYAREIATSGFPGIRGATERILRTQLDGYLARILDHEFDELGHRVRRPAALRRWLEAYAAATATTASYEAIRDAATPGESDKPARTTLYAYRDILERLWILDPVPAWLPTGTRLRALGQAPKHHLADPALAARLLGVDADALVDPTNLPRRSFGDGLFLGALFESLVALGVRVYAQAHEARVGHLRTRGGRHEIDLIVERADGRVVAIEVKLTTAVSGDDVKHLNWLRDQLGDRLLDAVVVTTGPYAYRRQDGIAVVPAGLLGP